MLKRTLNWKKGLLHGAIIVCCGLSLSSCATVVHGWNHKFTSPVWVPDVGGTFYVEGKQQPVRTVVSGGEVFTNESYYTKVTTTITYFNRALLVYPNKKYITVEHVDGSGKRTAYLLRRTPNYAYYALDLFLSAGFGSVVDWADGLAYDWEVVSAKEVPNK